MACSSYVLLILLTKFNDEFTIKCQDCSRMYTESDVYNHDVASYSAFIDHNRVHTLIAHCDHTQEMRLDSALESLCKLYCNSKNSSRDVKLSTEWPVVSPPSPP